MLLNKFQIIEFISVLMTVSSEAAEKELIRLGALRRILELFFEYVLLSSGMFYE